MFFSLYQYLDGSNFYHDIIGRSEEFGINVISSNSDLRNLRSRFATFFQLLLRKIFPSEPWRETKELLKITWPIVSNVTKISKPLMHCKLKQFRNCCRWLLSYYR